MAFEKLNLLDPRYVLGEKSLERSGSLLEDRIFSGWVSRESASNLLVAVVADGSGCQEFGSLRTELAIVSVLDELSLSQGTYMAELIESAILTANRKVFELNQDLKQIGTISLLLAIIFEDNLYVGNVGNSRAYWISAAGKIVQLTRDHNFYNLYGGDPDCDEARMVVNSIGKYEHVDVDLGFYLEDFQDDRMAFNLGLKGLPIQPGDNLLFCTNGLVKYDSSQKRFASDDEIIEALCSEHMPNKAATKIISWAEGRRVDENISVVTIQRLQMDIIPCPVTDSGGIIQPRKLNSLIVIGSVCGLIILVILLSIGLKSTIFSHPFFVWNNDIPSYDSSSIHVLSLPSQLEPGQAGIRNIFGEGSNVSIGELLDNGASINSGQSVVQISIAGKNQSQDQLYLFENSRTNIFFQPTLIAELSGGAIYLQSTEDATWEVRFTGWMDSKTRVTGVRMIVERQGTDIRVYCLEGTCHINFGNINQMIPQGTKLYFDPDISDYGQIETMSYSEQQLLDERCHQCGVSATPVLASEKKEVDLVVLFIGYGNSLHDYSRSGIKVTVLGGSENPVPEGTVTISGDAICRFTLFYGSGGCKVNFSSPGQKNILVEYSGDNYYSSKPVFKIIEVEK